MKILGFHFGNQPTVDKHIEVMLSKARKRLWIIRNLKNAKASNEDLKGCFCAFIRPIFDYCACVYHSMMNANMEQKLEKIQKSALKMIYGFDKSKEQLYSLSGLPTLKERRDQLFERFCMKLYSNPRFKEEWLEERTFTGPNLRRQRILIEKPSRTNRLYKCPIYAIRRKLNDILVK